MPLRGFIRVYQRSRLHELNELSLDNLLATMYRRHFHLCMLTKIVLADVYINCTNKGYNCFEIFTGFLKRLRADVSQIDTSVNKWTKKKEMVRKS